MPVVQSKPLPPRPGTVPVKKQYDSTDLIKAAEITIQLEDGTRLYAKGNHAADVYNWLMDCERYCASNPGTVSPYLGPPFLRFDTDGNNIPLRRVRS
jgi:hypothetical protein